MKKIVLLTCFALTGCLIAPAQSNYLQNYAQPSPNTAALGKYVDYPVSYYTGVPEISVPLYDLKDGAAHVPVSISYHASGIRVSEVASSVGLGWCLQAGGMITRTIRGAPDEGGYNANVTPRGYYLDSGLKKLPLLFHLTNGQIVINDSAEMMTSFTIPALNNGTADGEPDLFFFNFNGYSGKFVFDENRTPRLLTDDNLKISVAFDNVNNNFTSWLVVTPDGARYYFGENSALETTGTTSSLSGGAFFSSNKPSGWYLTRIIYPNTKDTVYFNYTGEGDRYYDLGPESKLYNFQGSQNGPDLYNVCNDNSTAQQNLLQTSTSGLSLSSIKSKNYTVSFIMNTVRSDMSTGCKALDSVTVSVNGHYIKRWALSYGYFVSSSATNIINPGWLQNDYSDTLRLKLLSVREYSGDGTLSKPPYKFTYQQSYSLPRRLSYDQDHWGYSNAAGGSKINIFFMPGVNYGNWCSDNNANAKRNPKWPQMSAFSLISVKDPLGVSTNFTFEENVVQDYPYTNVGGMRIKTIVTKDSVMGDSTVRNFTYQYGAMFHQPAYLINLQNEYYAVWAGGIENAGYDGYNPLQALVGLLKQSQSIVPMQDANGICVAYPYVSESFGPNGNGGSKRYVFDMGLDDQSIKSRLDISNFASLQTVPSLMTSGYTLATMGNGNFNNILPQNLAYCGSFIGLNDYPYTPDQGQFRRGKLLFEDTYDSTGNLIEDVQNTYVDSFHENLWMRGLKVYRSFKYSMPGLEANQLAPSQMVSNNDALSFYKLHTGISHLSTKTVTAYKDGKTMVSVTRYGFESPYHTLQTSDTTVTSQGDSVINKTYYSFDYANTATSDGVFAKMKARNMLEPVTSQQWKNHQLVSGKITKYYDFASSGSDTLVNPQKVYSLDLSNPLTTSQAGESIAYPGLIAALVPNTNFTEKADFNYNGTNGKITEQNLIYDKNQSLVWDNNLALPLAVVDNAAPADVAYCSFESAEQGNWAINAASVVTDATAPTGTHAYTLSGTAVTKTVTDGKAYTVSYWLKTSATIGISGGTLTNNITGLTLNGWTYHQATLTTNTTSVSITGSGSVDELRLYPLTGQMTTYTYDALLRLVAQCSVNSTISYYEYDSFNRLVDIKDQHGNVLKAFQYNYGELSR